MAFLRRTSEQNPFCNLATEACLCRMAVAANAPILYLWQNAPCVVIGRNQNPWLECNLSAMDADGVLLVRRKTGGGAVYHDGGNLNYSFCLPDAMFSEERQYGVVLTALRNLGIDAERNGRNDLVADSKKLSGSAFLHGDGAGLHHGTLLIDSDLGVFGRYLTPDREKFAAKGVKSVASRVANLTELAPRLTADTLSRALADAFADEYGALEPTAEMDPEQHKALFDEFSDWAFRYGKTPRFDRSVSARFPFGGIRLLFTVEHGGITDCTVNSDLLDTVFPQKLASALKGVRLVPEEMAKAAEPVCPAEYRAIPEWLRCTDISQHAEKNTYIKDGRTYA